MQKLTIEQMRHIVGANAIQEGPTNTNSGPSYPWEGSVAGTNTFDGNKLTEIPIVSWTARGGLLVNFCLYHNSQSSYNEEIGNKWTHSYDIYIVDSGTGSVTVHWGNDLAYVFTQNLDGSYSPPAGIHDTLTKTGGLFDLVTKDQVKYHFGRTWTNSADLTVYGCTTINDLNGNTITLGYNTSNFVTSITDPTNRAITLTYTLGQVTSITDPLSRQWSLSYTGSDLTQITLPTVGGNSYNLQFAYNTNHDITTYTDARSNNWTFSYNTNNSLAWQKDPLLNQTSYTYNTNQTVITDPNSHTTTHNYTSGKLSSVVDAASNSESYTYDSDNNRTQVTDRRGHNWAYTYDSAGNVLTKTDPLTHQWTMTYNSKNRLLTVLDPLSHQTINTYDTTLNYNLTQSVEEDASNNVITSVSYGWNTDGTLHTKTDANSHQTVYGYDSNGELTSVTTPNSHVTTLGVNALGVRTSRQDALLRTTSYTLDAWNRVTTTTYPDTSTKTFSYDANSNLTGWTDGQGTWARVYDAANRMTSESLGGTTRVSYTYDATGKKGLLSTMTDANSRTITYSYTYRNELYQVSETSGTVTYSYDANGNETGITNENSTTVTKVYDNADRLTSVTNKTSGGTTLSSFSYGYQNDNLRTSCTEANGDVVSYGYDAARRLTSESRTGANSYSRSYTLDGVGNRTSQTVGGTTTAFNFSNDDELTSTTVGGSTVNSYSYNNNGEQTGRTLSGTAYTLAFDYDGQLTSITQGSNVTSFAYDALGRRYSRTAGGTTTVFFSSGNQVLQEKQGSTWTAAYTYGNGLVRKDGEYPLFDGLGSQRTVANSSQTVTATAIYEGFGQTVATTGSTANPYGFAGTSGYRTDGDAGLMHVGARYYDPQVGRFITRDTVLSQHSYVYCNGDPVNKLDPSGHFWWLIVVAVVLIIGTGGCGNDENPPGSPNPGGDPPEPPYQPNPHPNPDDLTEPWFPDPFQHQPWPGGSDRWPFDPDPERDRPIKYPPGFPNDLPNRNDIIGGYW